MIGGVIMDDTNIHTFTNEVLEGLLKQVAILLLELLLISRLQF